MAATPNTPYFTGAPQDNDRRMAPLPVRHWQAYGAMLPRQHRLCREYPR